MKVSAAVAGFQASMRREWALLTSGQRWTAGLALALAAGLLAFGLPTQVGIGVGRAVASPSTRPERPAGAAGSNLVPPPLAEIIATMLDTSFPTPTLPGVTPTRPTTTARPEVVLVAAPPGPLGGPSDAEVARVFRDAAGLEADIVTLDLGTDAACALDLGPGTIVVTSLGLGPAARSCLVERGVVLVGYDAGGESGPSPAGGWNLSTGRGDVRSLLDLARWGRAADRLDGKVGLVASRRVEGSVEQALPQIRQLGVDVVATVVVDDGPAGEAQITTGVRDLAAAGVETVILAATPDHQRSWAARAALLAPGIRPVVSDLAGGLFDEVRPATFAGAIAHTSLRLPWFERAHGATPAQQQCRDTWTAAAPDDNPLSPIEQHRILAWCQHVRLVVDTLPRGGTTVDALRSTTTDSPLTSPLALLPDRTWGPSLDAVLTYDSSCGCWSESRPFGPRTNEAP